MHASSQSLALTTQTKPDAAKLLEVKNFTYILLGLQTSKHSLNLTKLLQLYQSTVVW
jgi:hypothetical protein